MMEPAETREEPFPAPSKQASGTVNGIATEVCSVNFADKIMLTISQDGRLSQWVCSTCAKDYQDCRVTKLEPRSKFRSQPHRQLLWTWLCLGPSYPHFLHFT